MNRLVDESDRKKTLARRTTKLAITDKRASMKIDPVSREDQACPWYITHT